MALAILFFAVDFEKKACTFIEGKHAIVLKIILGNFGSVI